MFVACSTRSLETVTPSGPVWGVTSRLVRMRTASLWASSADFTTLTPPPLPRPPAWTWALTTATPVPNELKWAVASSPVRAIFPSGVGIPNSRKRALAWYSWIFMDDPDGDEEAHAGPCVGWHRFRLTFLGGFIHRVEPNRFKEPRSEEHTSELQSPCNLVCRLLLEKKNKTQAYFISSHPKKRLMTKSPTIQSSLRKSLKP